MSLVFWFTGLSGAGKTTVADAIAARLKHDGIGTRIFDGDDIRETLHRHLGFSEEDILENNRLIAALCKDPLADADVILVPIISPLERGRTAARAEIGDGFRLIYFNAPLEYVAQADVKGLYGRAKAGEIDNMIGVAASNPYQTPESADFEINISRETQSESIDRLAAYIRRELREHSNI